MPSFTETLYVRAGATSELSALLSISGQSTGMEVALGVDTLPFGTVCAGSQRTQRLGLENRGDLPARFRCVSYVRVWRGESKINGTFILWDLRVSAAAMSTMKGAA